MTIEEHVPLDDFEWIDAAEGLERAERFRAKMETRHTIRAFADTPVERGVIDAAIATAASAPSGANHQPWHFVAIGDPGVKRQIRKAAEEEERVFYAGRAGEEWLDALAPLGTDDQKPFLETAPWLIAIFAQKRGGVSVEEDRKNYYVTESVGIATGFLIAALHQAGLATLTHTPAPMGFLTEICGRPKAEKPFLLLVTGYPAKDATIPLHAKIKKPLDDVRTVL